MPDLRISTYRHKSLIRIPRKLRLKLWWSRKRLQWKYGKEFIAMMDDCAREAERAFLLGQEHRED